jgi:hypothetical protein
MTIYDPIDDYSPTTWFPANRETALLVAALLACKDVSRLLTGFADDPLSDQRGLSMLATPTLSLLENTIALHKATGREDTSSWPATDRNLLIDLGRSLRKLSNGPLRMLRNTVSAHHDASALGSTAVVARSAAPLVLQAASESLCVLMLLLNLRNVFAWSRQPTTDGQDQLQVLQANAVAAPTVRMDQNKIVELLKLTLVSDPRDEAQELVAATLVQYNRVASRARLPTVTLTQSNGRQLPSGSG